MNYQKRLDKLAAELEPDFPGTYKWAAQHESTYSQALALHAMINKSIGSFDADLAAHFEQQRRSVEDEIDPVYCTSALPLDLVLAACDVAGILDDVLSQLRLQVVASNGCVSVLCAGKLLASLPETTWRERLKTARGCK